MEGLSTWTVLGVVVGSFVLTQLLVAFFQRRRLERIERKSLQLCGTAADAAASDGAADAATSDADTTAIADDRDQRVPITLITGFLGSGKTTLVNRVLTSMEHGLRIAVIENELGAISIDHALIDQERQAQMPEGVLVLKNGCMCCSGETPGSELERVLDKLLEMGRLEGGSLPFDCVLIEMSGLADPSPIVQILYRREMGGSRFYLDGVVCVVDSQHVLRHLRPTGPFAFVRRRAEAEKQIGLADRVVLNKWDLIACEAEHGAAVREGVRAVNASAALLPATRGDVPLGQILQLHAFDSARWLACLSEIEAAAAAAVGSRHAASVVCVSLEAVRPLSLAKLQAWLQQLAAARHEDLYRLKGVLAIAGHDERFVLHGVHAQIVGQFERPWAPGEARHSALVVIAHQIDRHALAADFEACQEPTAEEDGAATWDEAVACELDDAVPQQHGAHRPKRD